MFDRLSRRQKAALTASLAVLLLVPSGISTNASPLVTGHSTFYNGSGFDPCLASIVGVLRTDVRWFNDMVLVERYGGKGTYVYISENGSKDPRDERFLYSDGTTYDFKDPTGAMWSVQDLWYHRSEHAPYVETGEVDGSDPNDPPAATVYHPEDKVYVWVVELSAQPIYDLYAPKDKSNPNYHTVYNFVALVDTCRFHRNPQDPSNNHNGAKYNGPNLDYNVTHGNDTLNDQYGHKPEDGVHTHEAFLANIYVGKKPVVVDNPNVNRLEPSWEDTWAGVGVG